MFNMLLADVSPDAYNWLMVLKIIMFVLQWHKLQAIQT